MRNLIRPAAQTASEAVRSCFAREGFRKSPRRLFARSDVFSCRTCASLSPRGFGLELGKDRDVAASPLTSRPERVACFRMNDIRRRLRALSNPPSKDDDGYDAWLEQADFVEFLEKNAEEEKIIVSANVPDILILSLLVPQDDVHPPDVDDLLAWNCLIPEMAWSVRLSGSKAFIKPWRSNNRSQSLRKAEPLVFARGFDGVPGHESYVEIPQKFSHAFGLHYMEGRNAWCRLDRRNDIEDIVEIVDFPLDDSGSGNGERSGRAVLFDRGCLEEYAAMTGTVLVRMFDCARRLTWEIPKYESGETRSPETGIFYSCGVAKDPDASYTRGIQIVPVAISQKEVVRRFRKSRGFDDEPHREKFIVSLDPHEYQKTDEIACDADKSLPAFFRPEVLSRYKADPEKYSFEELSVRCRRTWRLDFYDINEAGQVHCFLGGLVHLPEEEQLYWKQFNEKPKAPISDRAKNRLSGRLNSKEQCGPLWSIKNKLRYLQCPWWKMRSPSALDRAQYPIPGLKEDWKNEIKALDQLIVEGFEEKWMRKKAESLGRGPKPRLAKLRSLNLVEECLVGLDFEEDHARSIVAPFSELHKMRNKFEHSEGKEARNLTNEAMKAHGDYRAHYKDLAAGCDEALGTLTEAFEDL